MPRREFLYDIKFWEARRILRGYRKRNRLTNQLIAECVYSSMYCMRDANGKTVTDLFPELFREDEKPAQHEQDNADEIAEMQAEMAAINAQLAMKNKKAILF